MPTAIVVHERIAACIGRLRPRLADVASLRWVESRSAADLVAAVRDADRAIVVINLAGRPHWGMAGLEAIADLPHDPLTLVLDPDRVPEVPTLARELGATLVLTGVAVPPRIEAIVRRFLRTLDPATAAARPLRQPAPPR